jgi:transcriptional regulator with XRE-family HTH domain
MVKSHAGQPAVQVQVVPGSLPRKQPLSALMKEYRRRKGMTLDEMAVVAGLAKSSLWELENDQQIDPRLSTLKRVCHAYGFGISRIENHDIQD